MYSIIEHEYTDKITIVLEVYLLLRLCMKFMPFFAVFKKTIGPGPAHAIDPTITNKGKDGTPHYSLSSRHKELVPFNTPGPGAYGPEKKPTCFQGEKQSPAYSIGGRSKYRRRKQNLCARCKILFTVYYVSDVVTIACSISL